MRSDVSRFLELIFILSIILFYIVKVRRLKGSIHIKRIALGREGECKGATFV